MIEKTTAYITKYGLTKGIIEADGVYKKEQKRCNFKVSSFFYFTMGKDCFLTENEARKDVVIQAKRKKKSLLKQLAKIDEIINTDGGSTQKQDSCIDNYI